MLLERFPEVAQAAGKRGDGHLPQTASGLSCYAAGQFIQVVQHGKGSFARADKAYDVCRLRKQVAACPTAPARLSGGEVEEVANGVDHARTPSKDDYASRPYDAPSLYESFEVEREAFERERENRPGWPPNLHGYARCFLAALLLVFVDEGRYVAHVVFRDARYVAYDCSETCSERNLDKAGTFYVSGKREYFRSRRLCRAKRAEAVGAMKCDGGHVS